MLTFTEFIVHFAILLVFAMPFILLIMKVYNVVLKGDSKQNAHFEDNYFRHENHY